MIDPTKEVPQGSSADQERLTRDKFLQAVVFGLIFGYLLQKGGVAKYNLLVGVLLFQDFTVIKMMASAIVTGMVGLLVLNLGGKVELKLKPTRLASVTVGGLLFGVGFGFSGYCPGTAAAALGQSSWDAVFVMGGLILGSYIFALASTSISRTIDKVGDKGKLALPDLANVRRVPFALGFISLIIFGLAVLEKLK